MRWSERPVIVLGHGVRAAGADGNLVMRMLTLGAPVLTSWQAKDLVDNAHHMYFGSPGIYGSRVANKVLYNADTVLAIGNRLSIWHAGYDGPRHGQRLLMVDACEAEVKKFQQAEWLGRDIAGFMKHLPTVWVKENGEWTHPNPDWVAQCERWREEYPLLESPLHDDTPGYVNSYRFIARLNEHLRPGEVITVDCGSAAACAFQMLDVQPPQRILSSGGLGEMGCALPAAIGASFARNKGEVLCLVGDGGLMLNLQELQTIVHHKLPIKIIVFRNDGYMMIRGTQKNAGMAYAGVNAATGISCPRFQQLAFAFGMHAASARSWEDINSALPALFAHKGPALLEYHMDPEQAIGPKLGYRMENGAAVYDRFDEMSPKLEMAHG